MNKFFKNVFSSCLGVFLALILIGLVLVAWAGKMASSATATKPIEANSVLHLKFKEQIPEKTNNIQQSDFSLKQKPTLGLRDIQRALDKAKGDKRIKGILLEPQFYSMGKSTALVLRRALEDFSDSGKFVYSMSDVLTQDAYYLASAADSIYINPVGGIDFRGFSAQIPFFKDMLDRLGIKMQVVYAGKFKSATEPFRRNDISPENRLQLTTYLNDRYSLFLEDIAESRSMKAGELRKIADEFLVREPEDAVKYGMVDHLKYRDQVYSAIQERLGLDKKKTPSFVALTDYYNPSTEVGDQSAKDKIAVLYAEGEITDNGTTQGVIDGEKYAEMLREIRNDKGIKALVLRINSPGGSVLASDKIRREILACKQNGLPVVVSMGDLAASGGYYIAADGDVIFAEPNTLTGSIGVFGVLPSVEKMFSDKFGIRFDTVSTGNFSSAYSPFFDMDPNEQSIIQMMVEKTYEDFLGIVSKGRGMTKEQVNEIAQGRVWTGKRALELGLVDELGDLEAAMADAAKRAGIQDYKVREWPKTKNSLEQLLSEIMGEDSWGDRALRMKLGSFYPEYKLIEGMIETKGVQARLPFILN